MLRVNVWFASSGAIFDRGGKGWEPRVFAGQTELVSGFFQSRPVIGLRLPTAQANDTAVDDKPGREPASNLRTQIKSPLNTHAWIVEGKAPGSRSQVALPSK